MIAYVVGAAGVILSVWAGGYDEVSRRGSTIVEAVTRFDALHYARLTDRGYSYDPDRQSEVAFFPAFPLAARVVKGATGVPSVVALLLVAHACLIGAFVLFARYLAVRGPDGTTAGRSAGTYALWAFALLPTTFFFRMPYSESLFVLVTVAALLGMRQRWPLVWIAALCGLATAVRPVGVALLAPLVWYAWRERGAGCQPAEQKAGCQPTQHEAGWQPAPRRAAHGVCRVLWAVPLGCWGLLAYMAYQQAAFDDALAFAKTQSHWRIRDDGGTGDKLLSLASWEPVWSVYAPDTPAYFGGFAGGHWWRNMRFFNPLFFCGTAALVVVGAWKRWLSTPEVLLSVGLLSIPYFTRAYEMCMESQGRFAAVAVPTYIVLGRLLAALPRPLAWLALAVSGFGLSFFASRFAGGAMYY